MFFSKIINLFRNKKVDVLIGIEEKFIRSLVKKLGKDKRSEVLVEGLETLNWFIEKIENNNIIVAIDSKTGKPIERFTTSGLKFLQRNMKSKIKWKLGSVKDFFKSF